MNGKIKTAFIIIIAAMLLILLCTGATLYTPYADATEQEINTDGENADDAANNTFDVKYPKMNQMRLKRSIMRPQPRIIQSKRSLLHI